MQHKIIIVIYKYWNQGSFTFPSALSFGTPTPFFHFLGILRKYLIAVKCKCMNLEEDHEKAQFFPVNAFRISTVPVVSNLLIHSSHIFFFYKRREIVPNTTDWFFHVTDRCQISYIVIPLIFFSPFPFLITIKKHYFIFDIPFS